MRPVETFSSPEEYHMPAAFVSGVAGLIGSNLARALIDAGYKVIGCDSLISGYLDNIPAEVEFHNVDCIEFETLDSILRPCTVVYHCAALPYEGLSVFSPMLISSNIVNATTGLLVASIRASIKRFIF